jgi:hypothetical protein
MRTVSVVMGHPLAKDPSKVAFVERNQPVETLPADRPDQARAECVGCGVRTGVFRIRSRIDATARSTVEA